MKKPDLMDFTLALIVPAIVGTWSYHIFGLLWWQSVLVPVVLWMGIKFLNR